MAIITKKVDASNQDGHYNSADGNNFNNSDASYNLGNQFGVFFSAFILFEGILVDQGVVINSANLSLPAGYSFGTVKINIFGNDVDDVDAPVNGADLVNLVRTSSFYTNVITTWSGNMVFDITNVIQEILDRAGWISGNNVLILIDISTDESGLKQITAYPNGAEITIDYPDGVIKRKRLINV